MVDPILSKMAVGTMVDRVAEQLQTAIEEGRFPPGAHLIEQEIAAMFGVSRGPVREALKRLAAKGLVVNNPYKGVAVREATVADVEGVYSLRGVVEGLAARQAVTYLTEADLAQMWELHRHMVETSPNGLHAALDSDMQFHTFLCTLTRNTYLIQVWANLQPHVRFLMFLSGKTVYRQLSGAFKEHTEVIEALAARDADRAEQVLRVHISKAGDLLAAAMKKGVHLGTLDIHGRA